MSCRGLAELKSMWVRVSPIYLNFKMHDIGLVGARCGRIKSRLLQCRFSWLCDTLRPGLCAILCLSITVSTCFLCVHPRKKSTWLLLIFPVAESASLHCHSLLQPQPQWDDRFQGFRGRTHLRALAARLRNCLIACLVIKFMVGKVNSCIGWMKGRPSSGLIVVMLLSQIGSVATCVMWPRAASCRTSQSSLPSLSITRSGYTP